MTLNHLANTQVVENLLTHQIIQRVSGKPPDVLNSQTAKLALLIFFLDKTRISNQLLLTAKHIAPLTTQDMNFKNLKTIVKVYRTLSDDSCFNSVLKRITALFFQSFGEKELTIMAAKHVLHEHLKAPDVEAILAAVSKLPASKKEQTAKRACWPIHSSMNGTDIAQIVACVNQLSDPEGAVNCAQRLLDNTMSGTDVKRILLTYEGLDPKEKRV